MPRELPRPALSPPVPRTRPRLLRRLAPVAGLGLLLAACSAPQSAIDPAGEFAEDPHNLFLVVLAIAAVVFVLVMGLLAYSVVKYREKPDDDGSLPVQTHGNTALELTWTIIPALILAGIAVPTVQQIFEQDEVNPEALEIEVIGHRWWWEYRYDTSQLDGAGTTQVRTANVLVMPEGQEVRLRMRAEEAGGPDTAVIHSYWVPALAGKRDVFPGRDNFLRIEAPVTGEPTEYLGQCAEYCGLSHANMRHRAISLPGDEYDEWLANQASDAVMPEQGTPEFRGMEILLSNSCVGCHAIQGTGAQGNVGPNLTHFATRSVYAGAIYDTGVGIYDTDPTAEERAQLEAWVLNAPSEKAMHPTQTPAIGMPSFEGQLTDQEVSDIVDYLYSLR